MQDLIKEPGLIPASDDKGHNISLSTRVPAAWSREIDVLIKERDMPYLNKGDFVRDAVFKHLRFCEEWGDQGHTCLYHRIVSLVKLLIEDKTREEFEKLLSLLDRNVKIYIDLGDTQEASKCVKSILGAIGCMPADYWKTHYQRKIEEKYAGLLGLVKPVRLI